jgi:pyruvate,orthophosphate dikinase
MPGMMDTVLNLGLNDESVEGLAQQTGQPALRVRRLPPPDQHVRRRGDGRRPPHFEHAFDKIKKQVPRADDTDVPEEGMVELVRGVQGGLPQARGRPVPAEPVQAARAGDRGGVQELGRRPAIEATAGSTGITGLNGTAVNVQAMVYGNMGDDSGTGVAFTRNPRRARTSSTASS